ncbi:MAG: hypothetical protein GVY36_13235 [Verrucomicrobia bacterium]|jgi:Na+/alanine symporter|nr:hypothetical protein [Verrucomicrobiota bacterium]
MYVIREALGPRWRFLAVLFAVAALFVLLPVFQANQLVQLMGKSLFAGDLSTSGKGILGVLITIVVAVVVLGDIKRVGRVIDTLIVCTATALVILVTGVLDPTGEMVGVSLTAAAFDSGLPGGRGSVLLLVMVFFLSISTMISFGYYGAKCFGFLMGAERQHRWMWFYFALIFVGSMASFQSVSGLVFGMYAVMAIPTMLSTLRLAPRVNAAARIYFDRIE